MSTNSFCSKGDKGSGQVRYGDKFVRAGELVNHQIPQMESQLYTVGHSRYPNLESELYIDPVITNRVKALRIERQWTQDQLAAEVGVSRQSINSIERERYVPSLPLGMLLARAFGCAFEQVFTLEER
jgi:putative transcriptional regulator